MRTYRDVVEEIALNLKLEKEVERQLKALVEAVNYAEEKMLGKSRGVKYFERVIIDTQHERYTLPSDFSANQKIVITDRNLDRFTVSEVEFETLINYEPSESILQAQVSDLAVNPEYIENTYEQTTQDAMYQNKVLYAMFRTADGYEVAIKPKVNGYIFIYYAATAEFPVDIEKNHPSVIPRFWHGVVSGATYYLLRRRAAEIATKDANLSVVTLRIANEYKEDFFDDIAELTQLQQDRAEPPIMRPFEYYDHPEEYL